MVVDPDFLRLLSFSLEWSLTFSACSSNQLLIRSWIDFSFGRSDRFPFEVFLERCDCTSMRNVSVALFSFALSLLICFAACCWTLSWNSASFAVLLSDFEIWLEMVFCCFSGFRALQSDQVEHVVREGGSDVL